MKYFNYLIVSKLTQETMTKKHHNAMNWCLKNDIKIYPIPNKGGFQICVDFRKKKELSKEIYYKKNTKKLISWDNAIWNKYLELYHSNK